ncbi:hypothetical protein [Absidia glauca]|uniref:Uncharacterized protein n=1 Tax=Absidia glauca TaxID=4829 RepID=A0A168Q2S9_ABSGL|nr:hypothetical protein [Absidia glauca]
MKSPSQLTSSSTIVITMLLHLCTIVEASPFFTDLTSSIHLDSVGHAQRCEGLYFSFPSATGLFFEENTKHIVAWRAPASFGKITLQLVKNNDSLNPVVVGTYPANKGATEELPLKSHQQSGQYHYRIQSGDCSIDSVDFAIVRPQGDSRHSNNKDSAFDSLIETFKGRPSKPIAHSNDLKFDNLVYSISKSTHNNDHQNKAHAASDPFSVTTRPAWAEDTMDVYHGGVWHMDKVEDVPEWHADDTDDWEDES